MSGAFQVLCFRTKKTFRDLGERLTASVPYLETWRVTLKIVFGFDNTRKLWLIGPIEFTTRLQVGSLPATRTCDLTTETLIVLGLVSSRGNVDNNSDWGRARLCTWILEVFHLIQRRGQHGSRWSITRVSTKKLGSLLFEERLYPMHANPNITTSSKVWFVDCGIVFGNASDVVVSIVGLWRVCRH